MSMLTGKSALVTGGGNGIGRSIALAYASEGASVTICDLDDKEGKNTVRLIEQRGGRALFRRADTTRAEDHEALVAAATEAFGRLDVACNNAGIRGQAALTADLTIAQWQEVIDVKSYWGFSGCSGANPGHAQNRRRLNRQRGVDPRQSWPRTNRPLCLCQARRHRFDPNGRMGVRRCRNPYQRDRA